MGAGVAAYHRLKSPGYVDTVYGGFYKRGVFERIGLFNEVLARNQDNELNARVLKAGFKIYFHPDLSTTYIQKTDLTTFLKRAYNFGFYHPATWRENLGSFRIRHFVPAAWVLYLVGLISVGFLLPQFLFFAALPLFLYVILLGLSSIKFMFEKSFFAGLLTFPLFFAYHFLYGVGIIMGFFGVAFGSKQV
jgi:GT2 family glycosyltransferase